MQVWLVTLAGKKIVGMNPFFKIVFKYSFVLSFKSNLIKPGVIKSILKSPVIMLCLIVLSSSISDRVFYSCSVNCLTSPPG